MWKFWREFYPKISKIEGAIEVLKLRGENCLAIFESLGSKTTQLRVFHDVHLLRRYTPFSAVNQFLSSSEKFHFSR